MSLYFSTESAALHQGDCLAELKKMPDESVHCCVTSPPYWGLRDYGVAGQLGLEKTPEEYAVKMVEIFREVRRVLRADGTCFLNLGDSYCANATGSVGDKMTFTGGRKNQEACALRPNKMPGGVIKPKDLIGIPWRVAFALQSDGWWLRSDIIWAKPSCMPESCTDRPTRAHEYVYLLTKSAKYYYDNSVRLPAKNAADDERRMMAAVWGGKSAPTEMKNGLWPKPALHGNARTDKQRGHSRKHAGFNDRWDGMTKQQQQAEGAQLRDVWWISPAQYKKAHFATFPVTLPMLCIKLGCPVGGVVLDPFAGSGTTLAVAVNLGRKAIGIELNPEYAEMAKERIGMPLFEGAAPEEVTAETPAQQQELL